MKVTVCSSPFMFGYLFDDSAFSLHQLILLGVHDPPFTISQGRIVWVGTRESMDLDLHFDLSLGDIYT
jgi:hypothetical protein